MTDKQRTPDDGLPGESVADGPSAGALSGCRVIELSHASGAVAGRLLADLGADVIKVEPPGGEPGRWMEPLAELSNGERLSTFWLAFNVSKRSVCLDLETEDGVRRFTDLARTADIVVTDFQRMDYDENDRLAALARQANPGLVWTEIWPFGRTTPRHRHPAGDLVLQALGGHLNLNGDIDRPPVRIGLPVALFQGGAEAASAALMAYYHRLRTGVGQRVDVSIQECVSWTMLNTSMTWQLLGREEERGGAVRKERANKYYTRLVWPCADGFVFFGPVGGGGGTARDKSYAALLKWMAEDGIDDPILTAQDWNGEHQADISQQDYDRVAAVIGEFIARKPVDELMNRAVRDRILLAPVYSIPQVLDSPQLAAREFYRPLADPGRGTELRYPAAWIRMSRTPLSPLRPTPSPGQDTDAVVGVGPAATVAAGKPS